jgi:hypothetical protein
MSLHTPKWTPMLRVGLPKGLPDLQSAIAGDKSPRLKEFYISLKRSWSVDVQNGLVWAIWTLAAQVMGKRKGRESNCQFERKWLATRKSRESTRFTWLQATCHISLESSWQGLQLFFNRIAIEGLQKKLCALKVPGVLVGEISGLPRGSPGREKSFGCKPRGESQSIL